ncbi:hypothetical protein NJ7G_0321 [Natrinema sp. J7-2]|nr:hypothetical protein NJ7G_0321 [Natrinema sp. J7-2]
MRELFASPPLVSELWNVRRPPGGIPEVTVDETSAVNPSVLDTVGPI